MRSSKNAVAVARTRARARHPAPGRCHTLPDGATPSDPDEVTNGTWKPVAIDQQVIETAWREQERYKLSWWDALIVAAAQRAGCRTLLSEDFQAGQQFGDLTVVNPFAAAPPSVT